MAGEQIAMLHSRMLRFLDEVERAGSIRRASTRLNVASSSINRQIIALEQEIGMPIFERLNNRLRLTESGALLIAHVRQTLQHHERMRARIEDLKRKRRSEVTVATTSSLAAGLLPSATAAFRAEHGDVKTVVRILPIGQIIASLASGESDLGVAIGVADESGLDTLATAECRLGAVVPPAHELAKLPSVSLADCRTQPLILADVGMPLRLVLDDASEAAGINLEPVLESNSLETLKRTVVLGLGVTFLYLIDVQDEVQRGDLAFVPIEDPHVPFQTIQIVHRPGTELDGAARDFAETIATIMKRAVPGPGAAKKAPQRAQIDAGQRRKPPLDKQPPIQLASRREGRLAASST